MDNKPNLKIIGDSDTFQPGKQEIITNTVSVYHIGLLQKWEQEEQPEIMRLVKLYGRHFICDLQKAFDYFWQERMRFAKKMKDVSLDPLWSYIPLRDVSRVLFLDPNNVQLYIRTTYINGFAEYDRVQNSREILQECDSELLLFLIGGLSYYDDDIAFKWINHLRPDYEEDNTFDISMIDFSYKELFDNVNCGSKPSKQSRTKEKTSKESGLIKLKDADEPWKKEKDPDIMHLFFMYGEELIRDLQRAYDSFRDEQKRYRYRMNKKELNPLWAIFPYADFGEVLFLDANNAKLYHYMVYLPTGNKQYSRVTSATLKEGSDDKLMRFLIGGMYAYDPECAFHWEKIINATKEEQKKIQKYLDDEYGRDDDFSIKPHH